VGDGVAGLGEGVADSGAGEEDGVALGEAVAARTVWDGVVASPPQAATINEAIARASAVESR
jgi:hypothetical protein